MPGLFRRCGTFLGSPLLRLPRTCHTAGSLRLLDCVWIVRTFCRDSPTFRTLSSFSALNAVWTAPTFVRFTAAPLPLRTRQLYFVRCRVFGMRSARTSRCWNTGWSFTPRHATAPGTTSPANVFWHMDFWIPSHAISYLLSLPTPRAWAMLPPRLPDAAAFVLPFTTRSLAALPACAFRLMQFAFGSLPHHSTFLAGLVDFAAPGHAGPMTPFDCLRLFRRHRFSSTFCRRRTTLLRHAPVLYQMHQPQRCASFSFFRNKPDVCAFLPRHFAHRILFAHAAAPQLTSSVLPFWIFCYVPGFALHWH